MVENKNSKFLAVNIRKSDGEFFRCIVASQEALDNLLATTEVAAIKVVEFSVLDEAVEHIKMLES